jgi:hypothetical protein
MENSRREDLEKKIEQSRRLAAEPTDPVTKERLNKLVEELEKQLRDLGIGFARPPNPPQGELP